MIDEQRILDSIDSGLAVIDAELKIYEWNSWLECATAIKSCDAISSKLDELVKIEPEKLAALKRNINTSLKLNITTFMTPSTYEYLIDIPTQNLLSTTYAKMQQEIKIIPIDHKEGKLCLFISDQTATMDTQKQLSRQIEIEVEKRLAMEFERQREREALIQSDKMAQLGNMLGAIIHQWKQPLNSIGLDAQNLKMLSTFGELDELEVDTTVKAIMRNIEFMSKTADDFRDFYKPTKEKRMFEIRPQIESVVMLLSKQLFIAGINISIEGEGNIAVCGYESEFKQVILNIISNAKDAYEHNKKQNGEIRIKIESDDKTATITLSDNAGGIPPYLLPDKLFEAFASTKGDLGTGIGLSLSRIIIEENMLGMIKAENTNGGACFTIKLPLVSC